MGSTVGALLPVLGQAAPELGAEASSGTAEFWVFLVVGAVSLGSALSMVLLRNVVHAALMLVVNFFTLAVLYAMLEALFLAAVQIIVYAGAIMVLFLFVIMLLGIGRDQPVGGSLPGQVPAAVLLGVVLAATLVLGVARPYLSPASACTDDARALATQADAAVQCAGLAGANAEGNVEGVGALLFTDYVWPFEVTSVLLVIAALGAMVLGRSKENAEDLVDRVPPTRRPVPATTEGKR